jgi:hypothetical protein
MNDENQDYADESSNKLNLFPGTGFKTGYLPAFSLRMYDRLVCIRFINQQGIVGITLQS